MLDVLRQRTAQLYNFLKQKFHTRTVNFDNSTCRQMATEIQPQLHAVTETQGSVTNISALNVDSHFRSASLVATRKQNRISESAESDKDDPLPNLAQEPRGIIGGTTDDTQTSAAARRIDIRPLHDSVTTAIVHREQSPWLSYRDNSRADVMNWRPILGRAKSVNINTGCRMTKNSQLIDDTNVRYNWSHSAEKTSSGTKLGLDSATNVDGTDRLVTSSSAVAIATVAIATAAAVADEQNKAVDVYTNGSVASDGHSDYQQPISGGSDQWSSYDPGLRGDNVLRDEPSGVEQVDDMSTQGRDAEVPLYVNTSSLAGDATGDAAGGDYMHVLSYNADDEADNVYLSLLDIVSIEERQIQVSYASHKYF